MEKEMKKGIIAIMVILCLGLMGFVGFMKFSEDNTPPAMMTAPGIITESSTVAPRSIRTPANSTLWRTSPLTSQPSVTMLSSTMAPLPT